MSSGNEAAAPAPGSTITWKPAAASFPAVSGTSATLRSPATVSRATPTLIEETLLNPCVGSLRDAFLHPSRAAAALRRRDARVVRDSAAGRDGAHLLRRARIERRLRHRTGDRDCGGRYGRGRPP